MCVYTYRYVCVLLVIHLSNCCSKLQETDQIKNRRHPIYEYQNVQRHPQSEPAQLFTMKQRLQMLICCNYVQLMP